MKTKRLISVILIMLMAIALATPALAADGQIDRERNVIDLESLPYVLGDGYIEFEIPLEALYVGINPLMSSPLVGNTGIMNAFFNPGQTQALSAPAIFNFQISSIPLSARVTNVSVTSQRTASAGVTYFIAVGRATQWGDVWSPDMLWSPTVNTSFFNNQDPYGVWAIELFATRVIPNPQFDFGAGATLRSATLRINFSI